MRPASTSGLQLNTPERMVCVFYASMPILWALGLMLPAALLVVLGACAVYVRSRASFLYALPWILVAVAQIISVISNMADQQQPAWMIAKHLLAGYVSGWLLLAGSVALGASGLLRPAVMLRAAAKVGYYLVALSAFVYPLAILSGKKQMLLTSPVGALLPDSSVGYAFHLFLFNWEDFLGWTLPRVEVLFPWAPAMGFAGVCVILVMLNEPSTRRRRLAIAAGAFMLCASMSRLAFITCAVSLTLYWFLGFTRPMQAIMICVAGIVVVGSSVFLSSQVSSLQDTVQSSFDDARPGSSQVRSLVYSMTWERIHDAPILGHGWPGESAIPALEAEEGGAPRILVGSHSTISGLIYKGGALTFGLFVLALVQTALVIVTSRARGKMARSTMALLCAVAITAIGEGLEGLVLTSLFAFLWIGIALRACGTVASRHTVTQPATSYQMGAESILRAG